MDEKTKEEFEEKLAEGKVEEDVYTEEGRDELVENDEISADEEGFMEGEEKASYNEDDDDELHDEDDDSEEKDDEE